MTIRSAFFNLGRAGAATAAIVAIGLAACTPAAPANTATNTAFAPANTTLGALTPGGPIAPAPGATMNTGPAPSPAFGQPGANPTQQPSPTQPPGAFAQNGPAPSPGGGDAWDQATYSSCVPSAEQNGASPQGAQRYCACVVSALDTLGTQRKDALTAQSPELMQAANYCRPQAQG